MQNQSLSYDPKPLEVRRLALAVKQGRDRRLLDFHQKIYVLLKSSPRAEDIYQKAMERIALWKARQLCSDEYISDWKAMLSNLDQFKKMALDDPSDNAVALRQNSPFSAFMKELKDPE